MCCSRHVCLFYMFLVGSISLELLKLVVQHCVVCVTYKALVVIKRGRKWVFSAVLRGKVEGIIFAASPKNRYHISIISAEEAPELYEHGNTGENRIF